MDNSDMLHLRAWRKSERSTFFSTRQIVTVFLVAGFFGILYFSAIQRGGNVLTLQTKSIPVLAPHAHNPQKDTIVDKGHGIEVLSEPLPLQEDLWVTGYDFENVNTDGNTLHHAMLVTTKTPTTWCQEGPDRRTYMILTEDQMYDPHVRFPPGYALRIPANIPLVLYAMYHNAEPPIGTGRTYENVSARLTLHTAQPSAANPLKELTYYSPHLADDPCLPKDEGYFFSIPANVQNYRITGENTPLHPERLSFDYPVTIKYWGAHLHGWQGGKSLLVKKNGELVYNFTTVPSTINSREYITRQGSADLRLNPGDVLSLEAVYDNPTDKPVLGAMGILYLFVSEE
jgi:hypothetical protein